MMLALALLMIAAPKPALDTAKIEELTGAKGKLDEKEGVFKVSMPRGDLAIKLGAAKLTPPLGLTSWAAFQRTGSKVMVMGDLVVLEDQVNGVMSAALDAGLEVTALHNHFFWDAPKVMFMHVGGMGDEAALAGAIGKVFAAIKSPTKTIAIPAIDPAKTSLDPAAIEKIVGHKGEITDGVYKIVIGRSAKMHGHAIRGAMGVNTWMAFAGSDQEAMVDGDFAMLESELQAVLKALRAANIQVVAIHNHMTGETPRMMFLHFLGFGSTADLSRGLKSALDKTRHQ